jgi:pimeloyl-ACP methyl ester carboxylesterase
MTLEQWQQSGHRFNHGGHNIFYRDDGSGDVLLCIHGFPTASWDWHKVWEPLRQRFRLIAPDMIGFGFSEKPSRYPYSIHDQATLHEELLAGLGIGTVHILAHDYGDSVAQELVARREERRGSNHPGLKIRSVCLLNGGIFPESHRMRPIQRLLRVPLLGGILARRMNQGRFARTFLAVFGSSTQPNLAALHDYWTLVSNGNGHHIAHKLIHYIDDRQRNRDRWVGALQSTDLPLRFIVGPEDPVSGRHMVERYLELIPDGDVVYLDGIGHYPQVEDPEGTLRAFFEFHDKLASRP